jgi:predicted alpha/beta-hydrolase family hydrolase
MELPTIVAAEAAQGREKVSLTETELATSGDMKAEKTDPESEARRREGPRSQQKVVKRSGRDETAEMCEVGEGLGRPVIGRSSREVSWRRGL